LSPFPLVAFIPQMVIKGFKADAWMNWHDIVQICKLMNGLTFNSSRLADPLAFQKGVKEVAGTCVAWATVVPK
jgi:hypothetical protein